MRMRQQGVSLGGLLIVLVVVVFVGLLALKLIPAYLEFSKAKNAIVAISQDRAATATVAEVRRAYDRRATVDDIEHPKSSDLEVTKEGGEVVISFAYRKEIPLFGKLGFYIDFAADSKGR